ALIYRLVVGVEQDLQDSLRNYTFLFRRTQATGTPPTLPRFAKLLPPSAPPSPPAARCPSLAWPNSSPPPPSARWTTGSASVRPTWLRCRPLWLRGWTWASKRRWNRSKSEEPVPCQRPQTHHAHSPTCSPNSKPPSAPGIA